MASTFDVLIIEDTAEKGQFVRDKIQSAIPDLELNIEIVGNLVGALKHLEKKYYDLVILDILIPAVTYNPRAENSRTIIEQLASGRLIMPACIVGLTAYEDEFRSEFDYYAQNLFSIEHFKPDSDTWLRNISNRIRFISRWKSAYARAHSFSYDYDLILITARSANEFKPIVDHIDWSSGPSDDFQLFRDNKLKTGTIRFGRSVLRVAVFCVEEMGMASAASVASQLIDQFRPKMLVMLGMCCGFQQEQCQNRSALGDVIVVREAACWDEGKYGELAKGTFFFNRARNLTIDKPLDRLISSLLESDRDMFSNAIKGTWGERRSVSLRKKFKTDVCSFPDIKYGLLLSGSSVVANDVKGDEIITRFPNALGLEMEVFGVYKAVDRAVGAKPVVLAVKGVADFGNGAKHNEFQSLASRLSYCVAHEIIRMYFAKLEDENGIAGAA